MVIEKLETERLIFRGWKLEDVNAIYEGLNDFNVAKNITIPWPYKFSDAKWFVENHLRNTETYYEFAIVLKETNKVIGGTALIINKETNKNKGGIWINQKCAGKGLGSEAWLARIKFAFYTLGLTELENGFFEHNEISWKMQRKFGYKIVGEKESFCPALNKEVKEIVTRLTKEDFEKIYK